MSIHHQMEARGFGKCTRNCIRLCHNGLQQGLTMHRFVTSSTSCAPIAFMNSRNGDH